MLILYRATKDGKSGYGFTPIHALGQLKRALATSSVPTDAVVQIVTTNVPANSIEVIDVSQNLRGIAPLKR